MLRVRANRAFKDHPHQTSLPTEGRAGPREGQELPQGHSAGWLQNPGLLRHPCPKSKGSSTQWAFIQSVLRSQHCGLKDEHWTESQAPAPSHCAAWASHCPSLGFSLTTCQGWPLGFLGGYEGQGENHWVRTQSRASSPSQAYAKLYVWVAQHFSGERIKEGCKTPESATQK